MMLRRGSCWSMYLRLIIRIRNLPPKIIIIIIRIRKVNSTSSCLIYRRYKKFSITMLYFTFIYLSFILIPKMENFY